MKSQRRAADGPIIPAHPAQALSEITRAWEAFVASGEFRGRTPRPHIARAWQRCRELGISPLTERTPTVLSQDEIEAALRREDLGSVGRQVLDEFEAAVEGTSHVIVLADAEGRIIHAAGHRKLQRYTERLNFMPGGAWAESVAGPNGVGTPLAIGRPDLVFGSEHYCRDFHPWVCYGCPVRAPGRGRIIGVVDLSGPAAKAQVPAFAL
ncbi:MAG: hypothetical protein HY217_02650, partial [Candidatus Rokubacteria bacterium]|nr:hypothetical protein [Candidatus Rokubacteria bacterium]